MKDQNDVKIVMKDHSIAKVELYSRYLEKYLAILCNTPYVRSINIYDLFCGEGIYTDGNEGSPIAGLNKANKQLKENPRHRTKINFLFNDNGLSKIDVGKKKIHRVEEFCNAIELHPFVQFSCYEKDFSEILPFAILDSENSNKAKSLFFIDPYGYKEVNPRILKTILSNRNAELVLFLPASHMYRLANSSFRKKTPGSTHIYEFLLELYDKKPPTFRSVFDFIDNLKQQFIGYLLPEHFYIDTFTLQRDASNTYCLIFFTRNTLGYEKMLESKWQLDKAQGRGFTLGKQKNLFSASSGIEFSPYPKILENYLRTSGPVTNQDLYLFGLKHSYLPTHTKKALDYLQKQERLPVCITALDGKPAKSYYLTYKNAFKKDGRKIEIGLETQ
jgi:three-Cys-motif partner protein